MNVMTTIFIGLTRRALETGFQVPDIPGSQSPFPKALAE
jgi:hypothetical protein